MTAKAPTYRYMAPLDCAGFWVWASIPTEPKAWAKCTSVKDLDTRFVSLKLAEHPTCAHVTWDIPNDRQVAVRLIAATQQPEPIGQTELW